MCGFTGWYDETPLARGVLEAMTDAIAHRGPDAFGYYCDGPVAFGHRRLSILDLAGSVQPMHSPDGRYVLAYNGELYNFRELRRELEALGICFVTSGDTEVLLQALIVWGSDVLPRLQGMFTFALWDSRNKSLLLARDHFGVKPLHYAWDGKRLLFGSEIKALLQHPTLSREIDLNAIRLYLECQYIPAPHSIYAKVKKLLPGHQLLLKGGRVEIKKYWQLSYQPKLDVDDETAIEMLESELRKSVSSMLVSDVPLGAFVSGGIDSSLIAALMSGGAKTNIFNICFDDPQKSEHEFAMKVASHIGANYHPLAVRESDMIAAMDGWSDIFDEPFADQAALPTLLLSKLTKKHVTVILSGEGADEIFAGYSNYNKKLKEAPLAALLGAKYSPFPFLHRFLPPIARKNRVFKAAARPLSRRYATVPNLFDREIHSSILSSDFRDRESGGLDQVAEKYYRECDSDEYLDKMLHIDTSLWLPDDLLTKVDRATMAASIEARVPYLDHRFVEFVARLPTRFKLRDGVCKYVLKKLGEKHLPKEIACRPKHGFVLPLREWLGAELKPMLDDTLATLNQRNLFRSGYIDRLRREEAVSRRYHATRLWSLMVLELWFRNYAPDFKIPLSGREGAMAIPRQLLS